MPKYIIERDIPDVGQSTVEQIRAGARESNAVLRELGPDIQWVKSYITDDKIYCEYNATNENIILEHAQCSGFPATRISRVVTETDPTTGE
ncbi:MAG: DUF4242 domain-containing protein [Anaerolineae bacterium]